MFIYSYENFQFRGLSTSIYIYPTSTITSFFLLKYTS